MKGFDPRRTGLPDDILGVTKEIWEERPVASLRQTYAADLPLHSLAGKLVGNEAVINATVVKTRSHHRTPRSGGPCKEGMTGLVCSASQPCRGDHHGLHAGEIRTPGSTPRAHVVRRNCNSQTHHTAHRRG